MTTDTPIEPHQEVTNLVLSALLSVIGKAAYSLRQRQRDKSGKWCVVCGELVTDEGCGCERLGV